VTVAPACGEARRCHTVHRASCRLQCVEPIDPVVSLRALRDVNVVKQRYDFSCGAASLATLVRFLRDHRSEVELLKTLQARYTPEAWNQKRAAGPLLAISPTWRARSATGQRGRDRPRRTPGDQRPAIVHLRKGELEPSGFFAAPRMAPFCSPTRHRNTVYSPGQFAHNTPASRSPSGDRGSRSPSSIPSRQP